MTDHDPIFAVLLETLEAHTGVERERILGKARVQRTVTARLSGYYLARHCLGWSWWEIARYFGRNSHQTVLVGCRNVELRMRNEPDLMAEINRMAKRLRKANLPSPLLVIGNFAVCEAA